MDLALEQKEALAEVSQTSITKGAPHTVEQTSSKSPSVGWRAHIKPLALEVEGHLRGLLGGAGR